MNNLEGAKVSVLEPDAFKDKPIIVKLSKHISQSEVNRLTDELKTAFPEAAKIFILSADIDMDLPREGTIIEAVPIEHFIEQGNEEA